MGLVAGFLGKLGLVDLVFQLLPVRRGRLRTLAKFLLDRLQLLVQIVLALGLLHLALDAAANALLHLQHADLAFHEAHRPAPAVR